MSNSFASVQNLNDYTNVSASSAQIISLSVNTFTNGPLTYYNVIGYAPTSFAHITPPNILSLSTVNGVSDTTTSNALVIPAGAYITSIMLTNNGTPIDGVVSSISVYLATSINNISTVTEIADTVPKDYINDVGYSKIITSYVANPTQLFVSVNTDDTVTAGSLCAYITYVMATNSPTP